MDCSGNQRNARELGLDRSTVGKYLAGRSKPATNPQTGSPTVSGPASLCDPWREQIETALQRGLSIRRIYQDLVAEGRFAGSYFSVRRFVLRRVEAQELPFRRWSARRARSCRWISVRALGQGGGASAVGRICFGRCSRIRARLTAKWSGGRPVKASCAVWKTRSVILAVSPPR